MRFKYVNSSLTRPYHGTNHHIFDPNEPVSYLLCGLTLGNALGVQELRIDKVSAHLKLPVLFTIETVKVADTRKF